MRRDKDACRCPFERQGQRGMGSMDHHCVKNRVSHTMPVVSRSVWVGISSQTLVPLVRDLHSVALSCSFSVFRGILAHPSLAVIATLFQCVRDSGRSLQPSAVGSYHFWLLCCRVLVFCEAASLCVTCDWEWLKTTLVTGATLWISSIADAYTHFHSRDDSVDRKLDSPKI